MSTKASPRAKKAGGGGAARRTMASPGRSPRSMASPAKRRSLGATPPGKSSSPRGPSRELEARLAGLEALHQQAIQLTREDVSEVQVELSGVQTQTLKEHQRRLAELNGLPAECSAAKAGAAAAQAAAEKFQALQLQSRDENAELRREFSALAAQFAAQSTRVAADALQSTTHLNGMARQQEAALAEVSALRLALSPVKESTAQTTRRMEMLWETAATALAEMEAEIASVGGACEAVDEKMAALPEPVDLERLIAGEAGWAVHLRGRVEAAEAQLAAHAAQSAAKQEELLARMDVDGDGVVDQSEFTTWAGEQAGRMADLEARLEASVARAHASSQESAQMCNDASGKVTSLQTQVESGLRVSRAGVSAAKAAQDAALGSFVARLGSHEDTVEQMRSSLDRKISAHMAEMNEMRGSVLELCSSTTASVNVVKEELAATTVAKDEALAK